MTAPAPAARRVPWLTIAVSVLTAGFFGWQLADDGVVTALQRDPAGLHWSGAWRVLTALLIQSDGWGQALFNLATLLVFGVLVERAFPRPAWLVAYLGAGVLGQLVGYAWNPPGGGGNSVAVCGLVGLIIAAMLIGRPVLPGPALLLAPYYPAALLGLHLGRFGQAIALVATGVVLGVLIVLARRSAARDQPVRPAADEPGRSMAGRAGSPADGAASAPDRPGLSRGSVVGLGLLMVAEAVALVTYQDHHGAALLAGVAIGLPIAASRRTR